MAADLHDEWYPAIEQLSFTSSPAIHNQQLGLESQWSTGKDFVDSDPSYHSQAHIMHTLSEPTPVPSISDVFRFNADPSEDIFLKMMISTCGRLDNYDAVLQEIDSATEQLTFCLRSIGVTEDYLEAIDRKIDAWQPPFYNGESGPAKSAKDENISTTSTNATTPPIKRAKRITRSKSRRNYTDSPASISSHFSTSVEACKKFPKKPRNTTWDEIEAQQQEMNTGVALPFDFTQNMQFNLISTSHPQSMSI